MFYIFLNSFGAFGFTALLFTAFYILTMIFEHKFLILPLLIGLFTWFIFTAILSFILTAVLTFLIKPKKLEIIPLIGLIFYGAAFFILLILSLLS